MNIEGPALELLLRRIAETPSDFLAEPRTATQRGLIHVPAVVGDLLALHGHNASWLDQLAPDDTPAARRRASERRSRRACRRTVARRGRPTAPCRRRR